MQSDALSWSGVLARFLLSLVLVHVTFNPEGLSFYHWAIEPIIQRNAAVASQAAPLKVLAGLALLAAWVVFIQTTRRAIGFKGTLLTLAVVAAIVWALIYYNILKPTGSRAIAHIVLLALTFVLTLGMSWSHLSRRLSGQVDTDDIA